MEHALLASSILICFALARSRRPVSPAAVFAYLMAANAISFYLIAGGHLAPATLVSNWQLEHDYGQVMGKVMLSLFVPQLLAYSVHTVVIRRHTGAMERSHLFPNGLGFGSARAGRVAHYLASPWAVYLLLAVSTMFAFHYAVVGSKVFVEYQGYLSTRTAAGVGIENPFLGIVHRLVPFLGVILSMLTALILVEARSRSRFVTDALRTRRVLQVIAALAALPALYALAYSLALDSRFAALQVAMFAVVFLFAGGRGNRLVAASVSLGALFVYALIMSHRELAGAAGLYGLAPLYSTLSNGDLITPDLVVLAIFNIFGGGFILGEAFMSSGFVYPTRYQLLSFSILPSSIDGFGEVADVAVLNRTIPWAPMSNLAEVYFFDLPLQAAFWLLLTLGLIVLTRFWTTWPMAVSLLVMSPAYYGFLRMHNYGLRHTVKFILLSTIICLLLTSLSRPRTRRGYRPTPT